MTKNCKILQLKNHIFCRKKLLVTEFVFIPRPPWRASKLQDRPSALKREHKALQNMDIFSLFYFFIFLWVILALLTFPMWIRVQTGKNQCGPKRIRIHNNQWLTIKHLILPYTSIFWLALLKTVAGRGFLHRDDGTLLACIYLWRHKIPIIPNTSVPDVDLDPYVFWASWIRIRRYLYGSGSGPHISIKKQKIN